MSRFALVVILAACTSAQSSRPPVVANTAGPARYTMLPFTLVGNEGRHSASHSSTELSGSLELRGSDATLTLQRKHSIGYVLCPPGANHGIIHGRQACVDRSTKSSSTSSTLVLVGNARWSGDTMKVRVTKADQQLELSCREGTLGLACTLGEHHEVFGWRAGSRGVFPQPIVFATPNLVKHYKLAPLELAAWDGKKQSQLTGTLEIKEKSAVVNLALDGTPIVLTGHMKMDGRGLWIGVGWVPQMPNTPLLALSCTEASGGFACEVAADYTVFDKFHRPETFHFTGL